MAFPPFPSQDLAKLVLGYLAEEQLMTAYDEFLQASPYLDAFRNEYDRIFMTSLKNILAEYRAVKIYVETCKPFLLRRKLFQCTNLLEVVKVLVSYIDINRLQTQENSVEKSSYKSSVYSKTNVCETCSFSAGVCVCKKSSKTCTLSSQNDTSLDTSIETTSLADLPGNFASKKRKNKDLVDAVQPSYNNVTECGATAQNPLISRVPGETLEVPINNNLKQDVSTAKTDESKQKMEEFNTILNLVCSNNDSYQKTNYVPLTTNTNKSIGNAGTFQEFAKGVTGQNETEKSIVPDSSTSDSCNAQLTAPRETIENVTPITNIKGPPKQQILLTVGTPKTMQNRLKANITNQKPDDQKITILSDIKVDNTFKNNIKMPPVLKSATSTPLLQFQTILINGTPAYNPHTTNNSMNYTKDEIMAMPTLFVVSAAGPSQNTTQVTLHNTNAQSTSVTTTSSSSKTSLLGPLVIDVPPDDPLPDSSKLFDLTSDPKSKPEMSLVTTVDLTHGSVPKNTNLTLNKSSTPHILPPTRKSSSTPRRSSHIRVLDFTTPRRILDETINEQEFKPEVSAVPDVPVLSNIISATPNNISKIEANKNKSLKEINLSEYKKRNWDAELRVLAVRNDDAFVSAPIPKPKLKKNKKKASEASKDKKDDESKDTQKSKKSKKKQKSVEIIEQPIDASKSPDLIIVESKPIVNSVTDCKENSRETEKVDTKVVEERVDTPENDRMALQNVIGAKLNISDFLETPYKQVLYDIQMETPKFLGPDMPDEPMSDIKIMNIPTPLFLNSPKPMLTPSSSRPTDYSSGGSYYKPDDQDYVLSSEVMKCAITIEDSPKPMKTETLETEEKVVKSSRPRRKCTKYVSYYKSPVSSRTCSTDKQEVASECSEVSNHSSIQKKTKLAESKKPKPKSKSESKKEESKKTEISSIKLPSKKPTPNKFMRIKPRRTTPVKEVYNKNKKKIDMSPKVVIKSRNRTSSKNKSINIAPIIIAAPTKSRRKSSTPRKIQCTKTFNSDFDANTSDKLKPEEKSNTVVSNDSDVEQLSLRWSDDGSQDAKINPGRPSSSTVEEEDITKIKEYIETSASPHTEKNSESLHVDLIKRGFDAETAKSIERDLLETPVKNDKVQSIPEEIAKKQVSQNVSNKSISGSSVISLEIVQDEAEEDDVEFTAHDCEEGSDNYKTYTFDEAAFVPKEISRLKEKYSMELCIDDGVSIRLRATNFSNLFHKIPEEPDYNYKETVAAVNSICDIDQLYTPMKQRLTCHDLFDSTLTSLDTPLKEDVKETYEETITEIVLEVENTEVKDTKKRKRATSNADELTNKKAKPETQYLLNSANIQNIDIESVLSKLHGP